MTFDTGKGLTDAIRKLLEDESVTDKRSNWILKYNQKIDLASLIPYMKTYFALPLEENEILFVKDEKECMECALKLLKGRFEQSKESVEVQPYWQRFCMKEVLEAVSDQNSKAKMLKVNVDEDSADALRKTLIDFCKDVPVQREPFTLRLVAPEGSGEKVLKKIIKGFEFDWAQPLSNKSIILARSIKELNDEGKRVYVLGHYEVSLKFMRLEDFFIKYSLNKTSWDGSKEVGEGYKNLPTETLFNCLNDPKCKAVHFEILRDNITKGEVIKGITSMLAKKDGRTGFTVHVASKNIADEETVKAIADAVSKLNKNGSNRFVVPMYKDNLFLFVDENGWKRKKQMENPDTFKCEEKFDTFALQMTRLRELLYLMSLPTSNARTLALNEFWLSEHSLELILDHGNRTGWSLTGGWMNNAVTGKSMYCLSTYNPRSERFLDKKTFEEELKKLFLQEEAKYLTKYRDYPLESIFAYQISHWDRNFLGTMPLSEALKHAEQAKGEYRTLKLEASVSSMSEREAAAFIKWIKAGLEDICKEELSRNRICCYLSLKGLSKEQRKKIMDLELGKNAKRELAFSDGDEGALDIGTREPFAKRLTKPGNG